MDDKELEENYEKGFMERVSEPLISEPYFSEDEEKEIMRRVLIEWLNIRNYNQQEIMGIDMEIAECIERENLQHLVSGGWIPLKEGE